MGIPHILALPYPAQGHVIPMMEVAQRLANSGVKVTFVNTEFIHERVSKALSQRGNVHDLINLVSIPDGLEAWEDRNEIDKVAKAIVNVMPGKLEEFIENINRTETDKIICLLGDFYMGWAMEVAGKLGIKRAMFVPSAVATLALTVKIQKLIDDGIIDSNGTPSNKQEIQLSQSMPAIRTMDLAWLCFPDSNMRKIAFQITIESSKSVKLAEQILCNSSNELEPGALTIVPDCLPIGPLLASERFGKPTGYFWPEESSCLDWLDHQAPNSVVYVAFGSYTVFDQTQFQELAMGLELTNRPFLWVVRQDITKDVHQAYPKGFLERTQNRGCIVGWAPQQEVLSHPSVACFVSHCGWNSTLESVGNGVPFLCWPYFADQFLNQSYICEHWQVGLGLEKDENGKIIRHEEIKCKVEQLLTDDSHKARSLELQEKITANVKEGGLSYKNFHTFINWVKGIEVCP